jgi:hypothetical protein
MEYFFRSLFGAIFMHVTIVSLLLTGTVSTEIPSNQIRLAKSTLYVNNQVYGKVINGSYVINEDIGDTQAHSPTQPLKCDHVQTDTNTGNGSGTLEAAASPQHSLTTSDTQQTQPQSESSRNSYTLPQSNPSDPD